MKVVGSPSSVISPSFPLSPPQSLFHLHFRPCWHSSQFPFSAHRKLALFQLLTLTRWRIIINGNGSLPSPSLDILDVVCISLFSQGRRSFPKRVVRMCLPSQFISARGGPPRGPAPKQGALCVVTVLRTPFSSVVKILCEAPPCFVSLLPSLGIPQFSYINPCSAAHIMHMHPLLAHWRVM